MEIKENKSSIKSNKKSLQDGWVRNIIFWSYVKNNEEETFKKIKRTIDIIMSSRISSYLYLAMTICIKKINKMSFQEIKEFYENIKDEKDLIIINSDDELRTYLSAYNPFSR